MTRAFYQPPNPILKPTVKPISIGGTNSTTPTDAAVALNCVHAPDIGQPESGVPLNTNAIVPDQFITTMLFKAGDCLEGNFTVYTHQTVHFFISNYDCQRQYTISAENAAVSLVSWQNPIENLEPGTLVFVGPPTPGVYNLTINGEIYPITVVASYIEKPTFTFPSNNSIVHTQNMTFQISNFNPIGGPQTQTLMEFQASNNIDFTAPLRNSGSNNDPTSNIFTLSSNGGGENIYVRARYTGSYGLVSPWSDTVKVIVNVINWPTVESALLHSSDASGEEWFGNRVAMNQTGDRVIVGSIYDDLGAINATGAAYIFVKSGITWVQEAKLTSTDTATIKEFGNSVDISADGSVVVVGSWNEQINGLYCGVAYIYRRYGTSWILDTKMVPSDYNFAAVFGTNVAISPDGSYFAVSDIYRYTSGDTFQGKVYVYHFNGSSWVETILPTPNDTSYFGTSLAFDGTATRLVISSKSQYIGATEKVPVSVFVRSGDNWTLEDTILIAESTAEDWSTSPVDINAAGDVIVFGAQSSNNPLTDCGAVYVFRRTGSVWSQDVRLISPTPIAYSKFGSSVALNDTGTILLVGQPYTDYQGTVYPGLNIAEAGIAYVFVFENAAWVFKKLLSVAFPTPHSWFGISCDLDGSGQYAVIGAMKGSVDINENHEGTAYIFN